MAAGPVRQISFHTPSLRSGHESVLCRPPAGGARVVRGCCSSREAQFQAGALLAWEAVVLQTRPMSYEEMVVELRNLVGERIAVSMALQQFGPADGYLADFSGRVEPIDDPIPGVDFPVHYVRVGERGFGIPRAMFDRAEWVTTAGQRELEIGVGDVRVGITKCDASDERRKTGSRRSAAFGVPHPVLDSRRPPVSSPCGRPYGRHPRHFHLPRAKVSPRD